MLPIDLWFNSHHNALFLCVFVSSIDFWVEWNKKKTCCFICLQMKLHCCLYCFVLALGAWLKRYISINLFIYLFLDMRLLLKSLNGFLSVLRAIQKKWPSTYIVYSFLISQEQPAQANISNICTGLEILCFLLTVLQPPAVLAHFKPLQRGIAACMTCGNTKVLRAVHSLLSRLMSIFPTEPSKLQWFISKFSLKARPAAHRKKHYISDSFLRNRHATLW